MISISPRKLRITAWMINKFYKKEMRKVIVGQTYDHLLLIHSICNN